MAFGRNYRNSTDRFLARVYKAFLGFPTSLGDRVRAHHVMNSVNLSMDEKILDAGCGIGVYCLEIAFRGATVVGVDVSKEKILSGYDAAKNANLSNRVSFVRCDICNLPFSDAHFDKALCIDVLEHIENDSEACSELSRILRLGGVAVIHVPNGSPLIYNFMNLDTTKIRLMRSCFDHVRDGYTLTSISFLLEKHELRPIFKRHTFRAFGTLVWWISFTTRKISWMIFPILYVIARLDSHSSQSGNGFLIVGRRTSS